MNYTKTQYKLARKIRNYRHTIKHTQYKTNVATLFESFKSKCIRLYQKTVQKNKRNYELHPYSTSLKDGIYISAILGVLMSFLIISLQYYCPNSLHPKAMSLMQNLTNSNIPNSNMIIQYLTDLIVASVIAFGLIIGFILIVEIITYVLDTIHLSYDKNISN